MLTLEGVDGLDKGSIKVRQQKFAKRKFILLMDHGSQRKENLLNLKIFGAEDASI